MATPPSLGCCRRFRHELTRPCGSTFFDLVEPDGETTIDPGPAFSQHGPVVLAWRIVAFFFFTATLVLQLVEGNPFSLPFFSYVTSIFYLLSCVYFALSLLCSLVARASAGAREGIDSLAARSSGGAREGIDATPLEKASWLLFTVVEPGEILLTIVYWALIYTPDSAQNIYTICSHGVIAVVLTIDGWVVGQIPFRVTQFLFMFVCTGCYAVWSYIHFLIYKNDDYEPIYSFLNWKENPSMAAIMALAMLFIGCPFIFMLCWALSTLRPKRYILQSKTVDFEEGTH